MPRAVLKHKAAVLPLDVYIEVTAMQRAFTVYNYLVEKEIHQIFKYIKRARAT